MNIEDIFQTLGLKGEETRTYLCLMETGTMSAGKLAKYLGTARPSVYGYLERLKKIGLVNESQRSGVKVFIPENAEKLRQIYRRKIDSLQKKEQELDRIIPELKKRTGMTLMRPQMQFFEGRDGSENALMDMLSYKNINTIAFWPIKAAIDATSEDFFWFHNKTRIQNNMSVDAIWPPNQSVHVKRYPFMGVGKDFKREVRLSPEDIEASMGYWIYADKVLFTSSNAERVSFIIDSAELVQMMSAQHRVIWNISKPISPKQEEMMPFLDDLYGWN